MVKIDQNNHFTDFIENFAVSQGNSEKNTMPVKKNILEFTSSDTYKSNTI